MAGLGEGVAALPPRRRPRSRVLIASAVSASLATIIHIAPATAATLQWDTDLITPGAQGGTGAWIPNGPGWWDGVANVTWASTTDDAVFGAPAGIVTLNAAVGAASLTFNGANGYSIIGTGTITFTGASNSVVTNADATIATTINNLAAQWSKSGTAMLTLSGANNLTVNTIVRDGTLRLGANDAAVAVGRALNVAGGTLDLNGFSQSVTNLDLGDGISSTAALVKGPGTLNLTGAITFNGTEDFTTPTGRISANVQLFAGQHTIDNPNANFSANFYDLVIDGAINGSGGLTKNGNLYCVLGAANTYAGPTNVNNGYLILAASGAIPTGNAVTVNSPGQIWCDAPFDADGVAAGAHDQNFGSLSGDGTVSLLGATVTVGSNNASTTFAGSLIDDGSLTKVGSGTLTLTGPGVTYSGDTTVSGGKLLLTASYTAGASVDVQNGATLQLKIGNGVLLRTGSISASGGGRVDIGDNKMIVTGQSVGTWNGTDYTGVTGLIRSGRNGGGWTGGGIVTSHTTATTSNLTSIGIATAQQVNALASASDTAVWAGQTVTGSNTLVMYTYGGDANLDGKINVDDYGRIDLNIPLGTAGWYNGDFNYDGKINVDDYGIIDFNIGIQGPPLAIRLPPAGVSAVPEPTGALVIAGGLVLMIGSRRKRRN